MRPVPWFGLVLPFVFLIVCLLIFFVGVAQGWPWGKEGQGVDTRAGNISKSLSTGFESMYWVYQNKDHTSQSLSP